MTKQDIEALHDAYRAEENLKSSLAWSTKYREEAREKLHRAHQDVEQTKAELDTAIATRVELEAKIGVTNV